MGSIFFIGLFLGTVASGLVADTIGRKYTLLIGNVFMLICFYFTAQLKNFAQVIVLRMLYGFVFGISLPISYIMTTEIHPKNVRGRAITAL